MVSKTVNPHQPYDRLLKRPDFLAARSGQSAPGAFVRLQVRDRSVEDGTGNPRVGLTVTKKTGNAVERNRIKRRLRAAIRDHAADALVPHRDYVFIARRDVLGAEYQNLCLDLQKTIAKAHSKLKQASKAPN